MRRLAKAFSILAAIIDLGEPCGADLAPVEHDRHIVLRVCARRGLGPRWLASDISIPTSTAFTGTPAAAGVRISMAVAGAGSSTSAVALAQNEGVQLEGYSDSHETKAGIA
ncbi:hypothetical protein [Bradyrhizobium tunisiense]|uniref:hypothetical protein n=1 Tax=Bradyrhizobium tunisiense TaxID=3278709 RepID=UPI0035D6A226